MNGKSDAPCITVRDRIAIEAMKSLIHNREYAQPEFIAKEAYRYADALIEQSKVDTVHEE